MKRLFLCLGISLFTVGLAHGQVPTATPHQAKLSWTASSTAGVNYDVYRSTGAGSTAFVKITSAPISAVTFTDSNVSAGQVYNYSVVAVDPSTGNQSDGTSPAAAPAIPSNPNAPSQVTVTVR